ncbi:MAG: hypothetical protein CMN55_02140 [Sneathiella sp.]|nr:hypothetical protein [Sneathiella sp.]
MDPSVILAHFLLLTDRRGDDLVTKFREFMHRKFLRTVNIALWSWLYSGKKSTHGDGGNHAGGQIRQLIPVIGKEVKKLLHHLVIEVLDIFADHLARL